MIQLRNFCILGQFTIYAVDVASVLFIFVKETPGLWSIEIRTPSIHIESILAVSIKTSTSNTICPTNQHFWLCHSSRYWISVTLDCITNIFTILLTFISSFSLSSNLPFSFSFDIFRTSSSNEVSILAESKFNNIQTQRILVLNDLHSLN